MTATKTKPRTKKPQAEKPPTEKPQAEKRRSNKSPAEAPAPALSAAKAQPTPPPARTFTKRELNQKTAAVLNMASKDCDVIITERGKPRWRIVFDENPPITYLERLEILGLITPKNPNPRPWPEHPGGPTYTEDEVMDVLDELRGDR